MAEIRYGEAPAAPEVSGWAVGGVSFAAVMMTLIGTFQVLDGIAAIANDNFFVATKHYTYNIDVTGWGWIHLILGILILVTGVGLFGARAWAGVTAIFFAMISAVVNFLFLPHYPWWSLLVIALDIWVIWALTRPGVIRT
jgi:hypothetical protein